VVVEPSDFRKTEPVSVEADELVQSVRMSCDAKLHYSRRRSAGFD
jgi:hypothetical protein